LEFCAGRDDFARQEEVGERNRPRTWRGRAPEDEEAVEMEEELEELRAEPDHVERHMSPSTGKI